MTYSNTFSITRTKIEENEIGEHITSFTDMHLNVNVAKHASSTATMHETCNKNPILKASLSYGSRGEWLAISTSITGNGNIWTWSICALFSSVQLSNIFRRRSLPSPHSIVVTGRGSNQSQSTVVQAYRLCRLNRTKPCHLISPTCSN